MSIKRTLCCLATSALFSAAMSVISALGIGLGLGVGRISVRSKTDLVTLCRAAVLYLATCVRMRKSEDPYRHFLADVETWFDGLLFFPMSLYS